MKRYFLALMALCLLCLGCACSMPQLVDIDDQPTVNPVTEETPAEGSEGAAADGTAPVENSGYELALITDGQDVESGGINQSAWEGLKTYGDTFEVSYQWYQPKEASTAAFAETIAEAVKNGARLVICSGPLFEAAVYDAQTAYPEISFLCIDAEPISSTGEAKCENNVYSLHFNEEQIGFLAGYSAVQEGYTRLGFMGTMAIPSIISYGAGFLQGVDLAARERETQVEVTFGYTGSYLATPETQTLASTWYLNNIQCIFACGGDIASSVMVAAEAAGAVLICADTDRYADSDSVLTSSIKNVKTSVFNGINAFYSGNFPGGQVLDLSAEQGGVALAMDHARFVNFTKTQHNEILALLASGELKVLSVEGEDPDLGSLVSSAVTLHFE